MRSTACSLTIVALAIVGAAACAPDGPTAGDPTAGSTRSTTSTSLTTVPTQGSTGPSSDTPYHPTLPIDGREVVRVTAEGTVAVGPPFVPAGPHVVVYADGTVLAEFDGDFVVQPMLWPYQRGAISSDEVAALLQLAADTGLFGPPEAPPSADIALPLTTVTIGDAVTSATHQVHTLGDDSDYSRHLREFVGAVQQAVEPVRDDTTRQAFYEPRAVALAATPGDPDAGGPTPVDWPGSVRLADLADCTVIDDPAVVDALRARYAGQTYTDDGVTYEVAARVALPGDTGCRPTGTPDPPGTPTLPETGEVIRFGTQPLFPVVPPFLPKGPDVLVYADGTIYTPSRVVFDSAPWAWPYDVGYASRDELVELFATADRLGLLAPGEARLPRFDVADAPLTQLTFTTTAGTFSHRAEALASPPADDDTDYYARIQEFAGALTDLADRSREPGSGFYEATAFAVVAAPSEAEVYTADDWPGSTPLAELTTCQIVDDPVLVRMFAGGSAGGGAFAEDGVIYTIAVATAFPDQTSC